MATSTTNYGWTKPAYEDDADIMVINGTIDAIDAQMKSNETNILTLAELRKNIVADTFATNKIAYIPVSKMYASLIVIGFFQGIGNVFLAVPIFNGVVGTIINLTNAQAVSAGLQGMFSFNSTNMTLDITTTYNGISTVTVIGAYQVT